MSTEKGTTSDVYKIFLKDKVIKSFSEDKPQRTIMHDDLAALVYYPAYRPIGQIFNQLGCELRNRSSEIKSIKDLITQIHNILTNTTGFDGTFKKCEY